MDFLLDGKICIKLEPSGETNSKDKWWDDGIVGRIKQIFVWYGEDFVSGFQTIYESTGKNLISKRHGGSCVNFEMINLKKPLTWLSGYYGTFRVDPSLFETDEETEPWNFY
ncbi:hypothetical protein M5K25_013426 [Dendrobium thyrsiflorum]|uniref:Jacalin-type lectin domain-containing protein n=1 Tax=Dendrobium thyrsiflorum TaxID=117978 RepID=A0ABD0UT50_DENTH